MSKSEVAASKLWIELVDDDGSFLMSVGEGVVSFEGSISPQL